MTHTVNWVDGLKLYPFTGCCGGNIFTTLPTPFLNLEDEHRKADEEMLRQVKEKAEYFDITGNSWRGSFIICTLTSPQVVLYREYLESIGFKYVSNGINSKTMNTNYIFIKTKDEYIGHKKVEL